MPLKVLTALDAAKIQWYHFKAIIIAGMGLFTDAYDLFCISAIMNMISQIYYDNKPIKTAVLSASLAIALLGTAIGQLVFGFLGDRIGRRRVYGFSLILMVLNSFGCGFSVCTTSRTCVMVSLGFFRFLLGLGIGADYPLSATIMSEFANRKTRGAFLAAVFSMQGLGILMSSAVTMVVCEAFKAAGSSESQRQGAPPPPEADVAWRLILMLGALPAALTFYWRMLMPETARYTALVEKDVQQAAKDMQKVLAVSMSQIAEDSTAAPEPPPPSYPLFSRRFFCLHGRDLVAAAANWFLVDVVFYTSTFFISQIFGMDEYKKDNVYDSAFKIAKLGAIVAACSTIPGYWFTVYFIDKIGRVKIQIMGFFFMGVAFLAIGIPYSSFWAKREHNNKGFMVLYGFIFFFANFGPNTTTFIIPAELFPARFRATCHGISGAVGKLGAIVGAIGFLWATEKKENDRRKNVAFLILGGICVTGMFVTYLFTRETKGRSLEDNEKDEEEEAEENGRQSLRC